MLVNVFELFTRLPHGASLYGVKVQTAEHLIPLIAYLSGNLLAGDSGTGDMNVADADRLHILIVDHAAVSGPAYGVGHLFSLLVNGGGQHFFQVPVNAFQIGIIFLHQLVHLTQSFQNCSMCGYICNI